MKLKPEHISLALFEIDPMQTGCREALAADEYDYVATLVHRFMEEGLNWQSALRLAFVRLFSAQQANAVNYSAIEDRLRRFCQFAVADAKFNLTDP